MITIAGNNAAIFLCTFEERKLVYQIIFKDFLSRMQNILQQHPRIPGLFFMNDFLSKQQELTLSEHLEKNKWQEVVSRRSQQFGHYYNQTKKWIEKKYTPYPQYMKFILERLRSKNIMTYPEQQSMTLIQEYMPGQSLPPHTDQFGDIVIGINLLANTDMTFVNPKTKEEIMVGLTRRGIYVLTGESRFVWKHGLMNITKRRISLTVRNLFVNQDKLKK